jgi:hypothetical protein
VFVRLSEPQVRIPLEAWVLLLTVVDQPVTAFTVLFGFGLVPAIFDEPAELAAGDFATAEPERRCNSDAVLGALRGRTFAVPVGEFAGLILASTTWRFPLPPSPYRTRRAEST